ncbi:MAG: FAD-dependent oxidoreductase [Syntrophales bacterium]|jgi:formate dehydrogenase beta subunit
MNTVVFSSWNGKIVDTRKGIAPKSKKASKRNAGACPIPYEGLKMRALMGWNGLVVLDPKADIVSLTQSYLKEARKLSCGECSICMIGIDRVLELMKAMSSGKADIRALGEIEEIAQGVTENAKCNFGRATALIPVLDGIKYFKADFLALAKGDRKLEEINYTKAVSAPCMQACPATLDIPGYIELIRNNRFEDSLDLIRERCILPGVIGRACTHPCESACVRNDIDEPLAIRLLKKAAADFELGKGGDALKALTAEKNEKVAIAGAGPAGLAAAYHLRRMGYPVTIFEALPKGGGMAAVGIPDYRLPKDILNHEIDLIRRTGVEIKYNNPVDKLNWPALQKKGFKALFLAVGTHVGTEVGCKGEDVSSDDFVQGADFLRNLNLGVKIKPKKKVVIIGGGNVALDCARSCVRLGFDSVEILYRRTLAEMPASKEEIEQAMEEGVQFSYLRAPVEIVRKNGKLTGLICIKMKLGEPDDSGRRRPVPVRGSEFVVQADMAIAATGQRPDTAFLAGQNGVKTTKWGTIEAGPATYRTHEDGIFAGGDCVSGPATLIEALNMGNRAALSIDAYLQVKTVQTDLPLEGIDMKAQRGEGYVMVDPVKKTLHRDAKERKEDFSEVEGGLVGEEAIQEAKRCLRCYRLMVWS